TAAPADAGRTQAIRSPTTVTAARSPRRPPTGRFPSRSISRQSRRQPASVTTRRRSDLAAGRDPRPGVAAGEVLEDPRRLLGHQAGDDVEDQPQLLLGSLGRPHLDHVAQRPEVCRPDDVRAQADRGEPSERRGRLLLDVEGDPLGVDPEGGGRGELELLELLDDAEDLVADRLEGRGNPEADLGQADVAQALLAEGRPRPVADELVGEDAADVAEGEAVARVLKD